MYRVILITILFLFQFGVVTAQSPEQIIENSIQAYSNSQYDSSKVLLQKLADEGYQSFELFYNLGNSYYKLNQIENAILYYEKARKLNPSDEDLLFNLDMANARITDQIPTLPGSKFVENVIGKLKTDDWAVIGATTFILLLIALLVFLLNAEGVVRSLGLIAFIVFTCISIVAFVFASVSKSVFDNKQEYIVFESSLHVSSAPNTSGKQLFVIHKGLKVEWLDESGEFAKIKLPDGNIGWVNKSAIREI